jgi:hypothetical protein
MSVRTAVRRLRFALIPFVAACTSVTSTTSIAPGQAFRLGGGQAGAFVVRGTNTGPVAIVVYSELAGKRDSIVTLAPGGPVDAQFPGSAMAVFLNTSSTRTATVAIKGDGRRGCTGHGLRGEPEALTERAGGCARGQLRAG